MNQKSSPTLEDIPVLLNYPIKFCFRPSKDFAKYRSTVKGGVAATISDALDRADAIE
jgi:hypothetical protein